MGRKYPSVIHQSVKMEKFRFWDRTDNFAFQAHMKSAFTRLSQAQPQPSYQNRVLGFNILMESMKASLGSDSRSLYKRLGQISS